MEGSVVMSANGIIDALPLWTLGLITVVIVLLSVELGWRLGNRNRQRAEKEKDAPIGAVVGAALGLLAFLLAFTFGMAATRYDTRKSVVLQESNAIGTTYLRADFLPEPQRTETQDLLREYAALRVQGAATIMSLEGMSKAANLQDRLWAVAATVDKKADPVMVGLFIQSLNETIDLDAVRVAALRNQVPDIIWYSLYLLIILTMATMGYQFGLSGIHSWAVTILLAFVFAVVVLLIADLDRPQQGLLQVSQQALMDLLGRIGSPTP
jgi:protein-S-isoprenylcysteine O-methyltransferase Ste14